MEFLLLLNSLLCSIWGLSSPFFAPRQTQIGNTASFPFSSKHHSQGNSSMCQKLLKTQGEVVEGIGLACSSWKSPSQTHFRTFPWLVFPQDSFSLCYSAPFPPSSFFLPWPSSFLLTSPPKFLFNTARCGVS